MCVFLCVLVLPCITIILLLVIRDASISDGPILLKFYREELEHRRDATCFKIDYWVDIFTFCCLILIKS